MFVHKYIRIEDRQQYNDVNSYIGHTCVKSLGSFGFVIRGGWGPKVRPRCCLEDNCNCSG